MHTDKPIIIFSAPKAYSPCRTPFVDIPLASLYNHQISHPDRPLDILIDEIQKENLTFNSPIEQIIAVGRNHRISVIAATQHFKVTKKLKEIIGNIQTKIFLLPATDSITSVLRYLDHPKITPEYLKSMKRGECIIDTTFYSSKSKENEHAVLFGNIANLSKYLSS